MAKKYDVIVVGAGPAGFLAAKAAGENGLEVALLEKKSDPTQLARACAQSLISMNEYYFANLLRFNARDKRICFSSDGFSFKYDGAYVNLYNLAMYTPDGHKVEFGNYEERKQLGDDGRVGICFDKELLFKSMLEEVKACNVDVFGGINVQKVTTTSDSVTAEGSGQSFEGRYLIAADGVNSQVARVMGFNEDRYYYCNFLAITYYLSGVDSVKHDQIVKSTAFLKDGHAHLYLLPRPVEGEYNFSVISIDPRTDLEAAAEHFMKEAFCAPWFKNAKKLRAFSAVCNCYTPIAEPYRNRVLLAGDVGSTQELEITGAMISGWKAGQAITTAVQEENLGLEVKGIARYLDWWRSAYINYYNHEDTMRGLASLPYTLTTNETLNYVYGLIREALPACWNPYTGSTAMAQGMAKAIPIIQRERPEILQKMESSRNIPLRQLLAEVTKISKPVL